MCMRKKVKKDIVLQPLRDGVFAGSNIAEIFDTSGRTRMSCGIHEIFASEVIVEESAGRRHALRPGGGGRD